MSNLNIFKEKEIILFATILSLISSVIFTVVAINSLCSEGSPELIEPLPVPR